MKRHDGIVLFLFLGILYITPVVHGFVEGLYCGRENCYDVLGVTRESTKSEISKAYRKLARKYHPDRFRGDAADAPKAVEKFQLIATAYETLKDPEQRTDYDYMLDNPEETYRHYYHYYRHRMTPKVDVRIVIAVTITIVSVLQYLHGWSRYNEAIQYALTVPKYRNKAIQKAHEDGLLNSLKKRGKRTKEEMKEEEESILRSVVENSLDIRGGHCKPSVFDILWIQIALFPYHFIMYIVWLVRWFWKFSIMGQEYGDEEKAHLMRKNLSLSASQWSALDEPQVDFFFKRELWIKEHFLEYKEEQEEEMRQKMAQNNKYKAYRRYMKKGGPGQMTFMEDD